MRRWLAIGVAVLALGACSSSSKDSATTTTGAKATTTTVDYSGAEAALRTQIQQISDGQFGRLYQSLAPAQKALVDEDKFVTCYSDQDLPGNVTDVKVKEHYTERVLIPGTSTHADSVAITTSFKADGQSATATFHEIYADGAWTWSWTGITDCT